MGGTAEVARMEVNVTELCPATGHISLRWHPAASRRTSRALVLVLVWLCTSSLICLKEVKSHKKDV